MRITSGPICYLVVCVAILALGHVPPGRATAAAVAADLEAFNVVWDTPSRNAAGSMPIGNGEVGLNVWVEEDGDLLFYIARTDAWSEASRLLKLGRVRVSLSPTPFAKGMPFRQELRLRDGVIEIVAGPSDRAVKLRVFVDSTAPVIQVVGESAQPIAVRAAVEIWRTEKRNLTGGELVSSWTMQAAPPEIEVWESADVVRDSGDAVLWYHRNEDSCVPLTLKHQSLDQFAALVKDPIFHRTFGGSMRAVGFVKDGLQALKSPASVTQFALQIATHSAAADTVASWESELARLAATSADSGAAARTTAAWWNAFWQRSWVFVDGEVLEPTPLPANNHPLRLGADSVGRSCFRGAMSRATVYGRALDDAEISSLAAAKPGDAAPIDKGRLVSWRFDAAARRAKIVAPITLERVDGVGVASFSGGYIQTTDSPSLVGSLTLEAWIRPDAKASGGRIFDKLTAGRHDGFLFDTHPARDLRFITGSHSMSVKDVLRLGEWNHVAAVYDATAEGRRIYLNGQLLKAEGGAIGDATPSPVTRAFVLQRWMAACAGRGNYPVKFNGSLFTVDPELTDPKHAYNPDWRRWGDCFWWQNTRFPAFAALANGDYDLCTSLFRMYREAMPICKARAKLYYGADGLYFPETMTSFGTYANRDYGWDRSGKQPGDIACRYWCFAWQQGLELVSLMLDYYDHTADRRFLADELLPMASEVLRYFESRFARDGNGKLVIAPTQAVETYWFDVVNDTPTVAGLTAVVDRLLALPEGDMTSMLRERYKAMRIALPPLPLGSEDGKRFIGPAEKFDPKRNNCENPELYAVWPFGLYGVGRPDLDVGVETFNRRVAKIMTGWCYDGQCAAILGLTDEARKQLLTKIRNSHRAHRFPAMWGPNFDWLPDQDHGCNILLTLQHMLMTTSGDKIILLSAWPRDWNVRFKLHAPRQTIVEGEWRNGQMIKLKVTPQRRQEDVEVMAK
jgi:hypothetical protein